MSDAPRYGKEVVEGQPGVVKGSKPATGPTDLRKATSLAVKGAFGKAEKKKKKKKGKRDAQGRLILPEVKIVAGQ